MKKYYKEINGNTVVEPANKITVLKDGFCIINPNESLILTDGWQEYILSDEVLLQDAKDKAIQNIINYDASEDINKFNCCGVDGWLNKHERVSIRTTAQMLSDKGEETMTLWLNDTGIVLTPLQILDVLSQVELYALSCYNKTQEHKTNIKNLETLEEVNNYNYKTGYPDKVVFSGVNL